MPGSYCYNCGTPIRWFDNIPILSYFILRGRCRTCKSRFSMRYALIELLTGLLFLAVFIRYQYSWAMLTYLIFTGLLLIASFTDVDLWIIPDRISKGGAVAGVALAAIIMFLPFRNTEAWIVARSGPFPMEAWWAPVANSIVGAVVGSGILWGIAAIGSFVFRQPAMGLGDVKLLVMIGAFTGWLIPILTIFVASFTGAAYGLVRILMDRIAEARREAGTTTSALEEIEGILKDDSEAAAKRGWVFAPAEKTVLTQLLASPPRGRKRHHIIFGPHLAIAAWILMLYEQPIVSWLRDYFSIYY